MYRHTIENVRIAVEMVRIAVEMGRNVAEMALHSVDVGVICYSACGVRSWSLIHL